LTQRIETRVKEAVEAAHDKKAINLEVLHVSELTSLADYFLICSGSTERQTGAIADSIEERLREKHDTRPRMLEGVSPGRWILMDYGDFIVHIFTEETRHFYALDRLWGDAPDVTKAILAGEEPKKKPVKAVPADEDEPTKKPAKKPKKAAPSGDKPKKRTTRAVSSGDKPKKRATKAASAGKKPKKPGNARKK
jgi:ribosome-associated protein